MAIALKLCPALAGEAQLVGVLPPDRKVVGSIPSQGTCLGGGFDSCSRVGRRQPMDVSLPPSLSL